MKYRFSANVVVEATSEEDALNKIGGRISAITRHLGNGETLSAAEPFFTLADDAKGEPVDLNADPIAARNAAAATED